MLRRISTTRLLVSIALAVAVLAAGAVTALALDSGAQPPPRPLAAAIHDALAGGPVAGLSADITFTDNLLTGAAGTNVAADTGLPGGSSPLLSGASGRLWVSSDGEARIELQAEDGDTEIVLSHSELLLYDVAADTAYELALPQRSGATGATGASGGAVPSASTIESELQRLMGAVDISAATPTNIGGAPAYTVTISPKHPAGLLGEAQIGWDALHGIPLDLAIYASGDSTPALELRATRVSFGAVDPSVFAITPAPGTHVVSLSAPRRQPGAQPGRGHLVTASGLAAAGAALPFSLDAPASAGGLDRSAVGMVGYDSHAAALIHYGHGLGSVAVIEAQAATAPKALGQGQGQGGGGGGALGSLPQIQLGGGVSATELPTALGTVLEFTRAGVDYLVAGFVSPAAVEAVARSL